MRTILPLHTHTHIYTHKHTHTPIHTHIHPHILTCLNRLRCITSICGADQSMSLFTTCCLRLQVGQCHASPQPSFSADVCSCGGEPG